MLLSYPKSKIGVFYKMKTCILIKKAVKCLYQLIFIFHF
nr:MAG TPA: hypothetical protein [Caudoviricetes sp.]